jgi:hypothetical protein
MSKADHHGERELAAFIRAGASRRPEQAYGDYYKGKYASCALGAAYEGMYRLPENVEGMHPTKDLEWFFDVLEGTVRSCPVEGCKKKLVLSALIVHINDAHRWSREQIATWLEAVNGKANGTTAVKPSTDPSSSPRG